MTTTNIELNLSDMNWCKNTIEQLQKTNAELVFERDMWRTQSNTHFIQLSRDLRDCDDRLDSLQRKNKTMAEALQEIAEKAEDHPLYMQFATEDEANCEGGDAAFVTVDIAFAARKALAITE